MKNTILLFASLLLMVTQTKAQTSVYHPFPDSGIVWRENDDAEDQFGISCSGYSCCIPGNGPCINFDDYEYFLAGDTLIGSYIYKKVYETGSKEASPYENNGCPQGCFQSDTTYYYHNYYVGGIRQDTIQRKVFCIGAIPFFPFSTQDTLLYDFNLNVGDTLPILFNDHEPLNSFIGNYVSSIDSILIRGSYRKRFWISYGNDTNYVAFIEGIGSTLGLLSPLGSGSGWFPAYSSLICVTIDSIPVYPDTATVCELIAGVNEIKNIKEDFFIYPNPATDKLYINSSGLSGNSTITIYNLLGETIYTMETNRKQETVNCKPFPSGIYFLQMKTESGSVVKKFVKE